MSWAEIIYWLFMLFGCISLLYGGRSKKRPLVLLGIFLILQCVIIFVGHLIFSWIFGVATEPGTWGDNLLGLILLLAISMRIYGVSLGKGGSRNSGYLLQLSCCVIFAMVSIISWLFEGTMPLTDWAEITLGMIAFAAIILIFCIRYRVGSALLFLWTTLFLGHLIFIGIPVVPCHEKLYASITGNLITSNNIPLRILAKSSDSALYPDEKLSKAKGLMTPWAAYFVFARTENAWQVGLAQNTKPGDRQWISKETCYCWPTRDSINIERPVSIYANKTDAEAERNPVDTRFTYRYDNHFKQSADREKGQAVHPAALPVLHQDGHYGAFIDPGKTEQGNYPIRWLKWEDRDASIVFRLRLNRWSFETYLVGLNTLFTNWRYREKDKGDTQTLYDPCGMPVLPIASDAQKNSLTEYYLKLLEISDSEVDWDSNDEIHMSRKSVCLSKALNRIQAEEELELAEKNDQQTQSRQKAEEDSNRIEMVYINPGCFQMGSNEGDSDEKPVHRVCLTQSYEIGKYEVTQAQWQKVMGDNPSQFKGDHKPVENVSWNEIQTFIRKLNQQTGLDYRLPTEAEWEYACRSGGQDEKYCGGNNVDSLGWNYGNSGHNAHPVGQKQANGLGLYDMSGNVLEWVSDRYGDYSSASVTDPKGPSSGSFRVYRGGSWYSNARNLRSAYRSYYSPDYRDDYLGFRLARTR